MVLLLTRGTWTPTYAISNICLDVRFGRGVAVLSCLTKAALSSTTIADK